MTTYLILAQHMFSSSQIDKKIQATSKSAATEIAQRLLRGLADRDPYQEYYIRNVNETQ